MRQLSKNFTQSDAEALGLKVGAKIACRKPVGHGRFHEKTGSVYQLWAKSFHSDLGQGEMERGPFVNPELQRGKIKIKG